ncbi:MAG: bifunctional diguanylate cyclase/phosphodiesterase [Actinomycetes bacterium]
MDTAVAMPRAPGPPHGSSSQARRLLRDLGFAVLISAATAVLSFLLLRSQHGTTIIQLSGGIAVGVLLVLPLRDSWVYFVVACGAQALYYNALGYPLPTTVARTTADFLAVIVFVVMVKRFRRQQSALGADLGVMIIGSFVAAVIREIPIITIAYWNLGPNAAEQRTAASLVFIGTMVGNLCGSAIVLSIVHFHEVRAWPGWRSALEWVIIGASALLVGAVCFTPLGSDFPGSRYVVIAVLLVGAARWPLQLTALATGVVVTAIASATAKGLGMFSETGPPDSSTILEMQAYLLIMAVSVFLLAGTIDQRGRAQKAALTSAQILEGMFVDSPVPSAWVKLLPDGRIQIQQANTAFTTALEIPGEVPKGSQLDDLLVPIGPHLVADELADSEVHCVLPSGRTIWLHSTLKHFGRDRPGQLLTVSEPTDRADNGHADDDQPDTEFTILVLEDVTPARTFEQMLRHQSQRDPLTGLPNRTVLEDRLNHLVGDNDRSRIGMVLFNIDGLRGINDSLGYALGNQVISKIAERIKDAADDQDFIARISGDEFIVIRDNAESPAAINTLAEQLLAATSEPLLVRGKPVIVTACAGTAHCSLPDVTEGEVMRWADEAMANVKTGSRNRVGHFDPTQSSTAATRHTVEATLRYALEHRSLVCHFQPIVNIKTGRTVGAEVLVRLRDDDGVLVPPLLFISLASELGLVGELTEQVIEQACEAASGWRQHGLELRVAVNAPPSWLTPAAATYVTNQLAQHQLPGAALTIEITEDETMDISDAQLDVLAQLQRTGVKIAIDDFGTGYAGLGSFRALPADLVKIDRSFINVITKSSGDASLVRSILELIHRFDKQSVAEGVETIEQYQALVALGCDFVQGYLISRPVPAQDMPTNDFNVKTAAVAGPN